MRWEAAGLSLRGSNRHGRLQGSGIGSRPDHLRETTMTRKYAALAFAAAAMLLAAAGVAEAGYYDIYGFYHPTCQWVPDYYSQVWLCQ